MLSLQLRHEQEFKPIHFRHPYRQTVTEVHVTEVQRQSGLHVCGDIGVV